MNAEEFADHLHVLRQKRLVDKILVKRASLHKNKRAKILASTGGRCHICGGEITGYWEADHIQAKVNSGDDQEINFLPAHRVCNRSKWFYHPEELQWILKLGVWMRTQIEEERNNIALQLCDQFLENIRYTNERSKK